MQADRNKHPHIGIHALVHIVVFKGNAKLFEILPQPL